MLLALACLLAASLLPASADAGQVVADLGFRPQSDGFSFANYGDEEGYANLDAGELQRLFGPGVCIAGKGSRCVLTPSARAWMKSINEAMSGGHCYGFAVLAELIHKRQLPLFGLPSLASFGGAGTSPFGLAIEGNEALQRSLARAWTFQTLRSVTEATVDGTPKEILSFLRTEALKPSSPESWTMAIFQRGYRGGHAITPYAVEEMGNGVFDVHVYDNNWPGEERRLTIDAKRNTWSYYAATKPGIPDAEYEGDAKTRTLSLMPTQPALGVQPCPVCVGRQGGGSPYNEIRLQSAADEHAHLLIVDRKGRKTGRIGNRIVNQIPGARVLPRSSSPRPLASGAILFRDSLEPVYRIPRNTRFKIRVDGRHMRKVNRETLTLVGPTYDATIQNLVMGPGQVANVHLSPRNQALTYRVSRRTRIPTVALGAQSKGAAYSISVSAADAKRRSSLIMVKRPKQQLMWIGDKTTDRRRYVLTIKRFTAGGQALFGAEFKISGHQQAFLYYGPLARRGVAKIAIYTPSRDRVELIPVERIG